MNWTKIVEEITPYIVKIETPVGHGTGFLCLHNATKTLCGIATAAHVVKYVDEWLGPIRLQHYPTGGTVLLKEENRIILPDPASDSAVILIQHGILDFPESTIPLLPTETPLGIGVEVGWLGYPAIESNTLCFFAGTVSARISNAYLIDGVAINGVSGGPVIYSASEDRNVQIVGDVSAYRVNRATGEALPGLLVARDLSHFHAVITHMKSLEEAAEAKRLEAEQASQVAEAAASVAPVESETKGTLEVTPRTIAAS